MSKNSNINYNENNFSKARYNKVEVLKKILYGILSPVLRTVLRSSNANKKILKTNLKLYYNKAQHLNFFFQHEINYESAFRDKMLEYIKKDDLVFEIGSNIGQHSLLISEKISPLGKLVCIEPDSSNIQYLKHNVSQNNCRNIEVLQVAVSDHIGKTTFYKDSVTGGRMSSLIKKYTENKFEGNVEEVNLLTVDELIRRYGVPAFIKVDVEGAESLVFHDSIVLNPQTKYLIEVREETKDHIFNLFHRHGFQIFQIDNAMTELHHASEIPGFANLFMLKNPTNKLNSDV